LPSMQPMKDIASFEQMQEWQQQFNLGLRESEAAVNATCEVSAGRWVPDGMSGAGVPLRMLYAEDALSKSSMAAPDTQRKEKSLLYALRLYTHARWLAERQHATAAEQRYRAAAEVALREERPELGGHALARLGYYLMGWGRFAEARLVLKEAASYAGEENPAASFLHGVMERRFAIQMGDAQALYAADALILDSGKQPSKQLEEERRNIVKEIHFWKDASNSREKCLSSDDAAHFVICGLLHAVVHVQKLLS